MVEQFQEPSSVLQQTPCEKDCDTGKRLRKRPRMPRRVLRRWWNRCQGIARCSFACSRFCKQRRTLEETETQIASYPEYPQAAQSPYHLIMTMVNEGGLRWIELDAQGQELTDERKAGLSEVEIVTLSTFCSSATEIGDDVSIRSFHLNRACVHCLTRFRSAWALTSTS